MLIKIKSFEPALYDRTQNARKAWDRGVAQYALDICANLRKRGISSVAPNSPAFRQQCLDGASDWADYSAKGKSLMLKCEIADRLFSPLESRQILKAYGRAQQGEYMRQAQARALGEAFALLCNAATTHAHQYDATSAA